MPKFVTVDIYFSAEERAMIEFVAAEQRIDPADFVKRMALQGARFDLANAKNTQKDRSLRPAS